MHITPGTLMHYALCIIWALHSLSSWGMMEFHALLKLCNTTLCIITDSIVDRMTGPSMNSRSVRVRSKYLS